MEIKTEEYNIWYDSTTGTVTCLGSLRLSGMEEYAPIVQLLNHVAAQELPMIILNLRGLEFLNSTGINILSRFVLKMRHSKNTQMVIQGSNDIPWQEFALENLQRLMPRLQLQLE